MEKLNICLKLLKTKENMRMISSIISQNRSIEVEDLANEYYLFCEDRNIYPNSQITKWWLINKCKNIFGVQKNKYTKIDIEDHDINNISENIDYENMICNKIILEDLIKTLTRKEKKILYEKFVNDKTNKVIAYELKLSEETVRKRIIKILKKLKDRSK